MKIRDEFSQHADTYEKYNIIQSKVIERMIDLLADKPGRILDIGCGSGGFFKAIEWPLKQYVGIDFAQGMIDRHPKGQNIALFARDFNDPGWTRGMDTFSFNRIVSASALQWAEDLDRVFGEIAAFKTPVTLAIFTSGTFATLHECASLPPLLRSADEIKVRAEKHFDAKYELLRYTLEFPTVRAMFRYMKKSGVGGARNLLGYAQMKALMQTYPLDCLEFEILLIHE